MQSKHKNTTRLIVSLVFFVAFFYFVFFSITHIDWSKDETGETKLSKIANTLTEPIPPSSVKQDAKLPDSVKLVVPFTSQAPFAEWDALHEDACEEASLIMVAHYYNKAPLGDTVNVDAEINHLIDYENTLGFGTSITLTELDQVANAKYNLTGQVKSNINIEKIKQEISLGHPIIVGAAGKVLPNPNFRNGGPNYHMLVIIGYDSENFITNDPGTRNGKEFVYSYNDLINSIHDWNPDNILNGEKNYLVF